MQKVVTAKVRKLPLPLEIRLSPESSVFDGLFTLTSKDAGTIKIVAVDKDDFATYLTCEIYPPKTDKTQSRKLTDIFTSDTPIGSELSRSRGLGKELGQYKYYKRNDGNLYVIIESTDGRARRLQIGNPMDRNSSIAIIARAILQSFSTEEFTKAKLMRVIPKQLAYGQILKATLDAMNIEGYIEKTNSPVRGRLRENFRATAKLSSFIVTPEQA
jgi:hypothetical protein